MSAKPWFKFYIEDWRGDAQLRACTPHARAVWFEMILVMVKATPLGHLAGPDGAELTLKSFSRISGMTVAEIKAGITELEEHEVFSRAETGVIFSRKMVRDHTLSVRQRERVNKRWAAVKERESEKKPTPPVLPDAMPKNPESRKKEKKPSANASGSDQPIAAPAPPAPAPKRKGYVVDIPKPEQAAFDAYNDIAAELGLAPAQVLTPQRKKKLRALLRTHTAVGFTRALDMLRHSPFATGKNRTGWKMDLGELLDPEKFNRLLEGGYTERKTDGTATDRPHQDRATAAGDARRANLRRAFAAAGGGPDDAE